MKCNTLHKKLIFFLEGNLSPTETEEIQNHLDECTSCASFAKELKLTLGIIDFEKKLEVRPYFYTRLKSKMENQTTEKPSNFGRFILARVLQPAIFSIILAIGIYTGIKIGQPAPTQQYTTTLMQNQELLYLNEMASETIELSLME